ncbi:MAG: MATE family efflux transporter, partial [Oscillospiraceae bacterium]
VIGTEALAGLGVTFPIIMLISAFSALIGMGGAPKAAIFMGKKDNDTAEKILGNCVSMLTGVSIILSAIFYFTKDSILLTFGASESTLPYANSYLSIYLLGTVFVQVALGLNAFITTQGFSSVSMITVSVGAILNIILDPIFIFALDMGVQGAALATIISQAVSATLVFSFLCSKRSKIKIKRHNLKLNRKIVFPVLALGTAPFIMQATECLVQLTFNKSMNIYGNDYYVALMSILFSIMQLVFMPMQGFTQGAQPIISYNYGAKNHDRVKKTFGLLVKSTLSFSIVIVGLVEIFPAFFIGLFTPDQNVIEIGIPSLRIFLMGMLIMGAQTACQTTFLSVGEAKSSMFLALLRKVILLLPLAIILPRIGGLGIKGVFLAEAIADFVAVTITVIYFQTKKKQIFFPKEEQ